MPPRTDKCIADTLHKLPHSPVSFFPPTVLNSKIQGSKRLWVGEWHLGNTLAPAACLLSCLIHSLYHLIRRMRRCGGEALSPWDRKGGAVLHLLLPWPSSLLRLRAVCVANIAPGGCELPCEHTSSGDRQHTHSGTSEDSWMWRKKLGGNVKKAGFQWSYERFFWIV